jgi:RNA polymerase sigma-70 factor (ECF subfamily)
MKPSRHDSLGCSAMPGIGSGGSAEMRESVILEGVRSGDERAWSLLYAELAPRVRGYFRAQRMAHPDDLTGDVFLEVARRIKGFSGDMPGFRAWVFTIAHSRVVDEIRRSSRRGEQTGLDEVAPMASGDDVEGEVLGALRRRELLVAMEYLTVEQRQTVMLRLFGGLSVAETAAALGRSTAAVKMLHSRACTALRRHFSEQGVTEFADERL